MKILCVNQFFTPDRVATAQVLADLCEHLIREGHQVHVLCSRGRYDEGNSRFTPLPHRERIGQVEVERVGGTGFGKRFRTGQLLEFLAFHLLAGLNLLKNAHRYDLVVTLTTPPLLGLWGTLARALTGVRHVQWVMNLHPDVEIQLGVLGARNPVARLLEGLNALSLKRADACVALGSCVARRIIAKGVKRDRVRVIPLWGHAFEKAEPSRRNPLRALWDLEGKFVVMYSGNAGIEYMFEALCESAERLRDDARFVFLFIGGGRRTAEIDRFRQLRDLSNIRMMGYVPREQLQHSLGLADVHFVCLRPELAGVSVPCKLYGAMSVGRPVLFVGSKDCETSDAIRRYGCGETFAPDDVDGVTRFLQELADKPDLCDQLGAASRHGFEDCYNPARGLRLLSELFVEIAGGSHADPRRRIGAKQGSVV